MKTSNITEYVERYLDGKLKDGDLWEFRIRLEKDKKLARELKLQQELNETLQDTDKMKLRKSLNKAYLKSNKVQSIKFTYKIQTAVAAAVVIMILAGGGLMFNYLQNSTTTNMALYEQYFDNEESLFTVRAGESNLNNEIESGMDAYKDHDYLLAIQIFANKSENMAANLYAGLSYMQLSDYDNAEYKFEQVIENNDNLFIDQAEFNLALCYLASNKIDKALMALNKVIESNSVYTNKAEDLKNEISKK